MNMVLTQTTIHATSGVPWLSILVALPTVVAAALWLIKPLRLAGRQIALLTALAVLVFTVVAAISEFDLSQAQNYQLGETYPWIPAIGLSWALGVNGLALLMIILATALVPLVMVAGWSDDTDQDAQSGYFALLLFLETFMILVFAARDLLLFYIAFEGMLIPLYFLIGRFGGENRRFAAVKFILYSLAGGLIMLFGVVGVYVYNSGPQAFLLDNLTKDGGVVAGGNELLLLLTFFIAFAIKAPMVPVHTWLPTTAQAARPGTSVLLVGVLDKVGTFGMIVYCWGMFPEASHQIAPYVIIFAVISVLYGALAVIWQRDILRLVSFTSISHFGFMVMALYVGSITAIEGAMLYMLAHGVSIAAMFLLAGWLSQRGGTQDLNAYGGMQKVTPYLAGMFLISGLAAIALPGLSGFVPEYMILMGTFRVLPAAAIIAIFGVVLAAVYLLLPYQKIFTGPTPENRKQLRDLGVREQAVMVPLIAAMFILGFMPGLALQFISPAAEDLGSVAGIEKFEATRVDPLPAADALATIEGSAL